MTTSATSYPLAWPEGWPRNKRPQDARFKVTLDSAIAELEAAIEKLGGTLPVLSTNVPRNLRGGLDMRRGPDNGDAGVAVYFHRKGRPQVFACDKWNTVRDNIRAIQRTLEALHSIERWGATEILDRAFSAFLALPPPLRWHEVLGVSPMASNDEVKAAHRRLAAEHHPDRGGSVAKMAEINEARDVGLGSRGT